jgi:hypothetical protein
MFENLKIKNQCKKSADAVATYRQRKADFDSIFQETKNLQPGIEGAWLAYFACERTGGDADRLQELKDTFTKLLNEKIGPRRAASVEVETAEKEPRRINHPFQSAFARWGRDVMEAAPYNAEFVACIQKAISEIESMSLQSLEKILEAIELHRSKIECWEFAEKPKNNMPAFRLQDVALSA